MYCPYDGQRLENLGESEPGVVEASCPHCGRVFELIREEEEEDEPMLFLTEIQGPWTLDDLIKSELEA
jgi:hypothetical protein